jgi:hypothetical protein
MKKFINNKMYNTETAELIKEYWNGREKNDNYYHVERLYKTETGDMFLYYSGGIYTEYEGREDIIPLKPHDVYNWLDRIDRITAIEKYFANVLGEELLRAINISVQRLD